MYSVNDILTMLEKGEKPETIAQRFTDSLNAAIDQKKKADEAAKKKAEEKAKAEAEKKLQEAKKRELLQDILDELHKWFETYYPKLGVQKTFTADEVMSFLDETITSMKEFNKLLNKFPEEKKNSIADQAIDDFLKMFGL